jgi:hypothetical protein
MSTSPTEILTGLAIPSGFLLLFLLSGAALPVSVSIGGPRSEVEGFTQLFLTLVSGMAFLALFGIAWSLAGLGGGRPPLFSVLLFTTVGLVLRFRKGRPRWRIQRADLGVAGGTVWRPDLQGALEFHIADTRALQQGDPQ